MIDNDKADLASRSANSLPRMLMWLGSQQKQFLEKLKGNYLFLNIKDFLQEKYETLQRRDVKPDAEWCRKHFKYDFFVQKLYPVKP